MGLATLNAKLRAWLNTLLTPKDIQLLSEETTIQGFIKILSQKEYKFSEYIQKNFPENPIFVVKNLPILYAINASKYLSPKDSKLLETWLLYYEFENLKLALRSIVTQKPIKTAYDLGRFSPLTPSVVRGIRSLQELDRLIRNRIYYRYIRYSLEKLKETSDTRLIEIHLDILYINFLMNRFRRARNRLKEKGIKFLERILAEETIRWIYKQKFIFEIAREIILGYTRFEYLDDIGKKMCNTLVTVPSEQDFINTINHYKHYLGLKENVSNIEEFQEKMREVLIKEAKKQFFGIPFFIGELFGFLWLKQRDVEIYIKLIEEKGF